MLSVIQQLLHNITSTLYTRNATPNKYNIIQKLLNNTSDNFSTLCYNITEPILHIYLICITSNTTAQYYIMQNWFSNTMQNICFF